MCFTAAVHIVGAGGQHLLQHAVLPAGGAVDGLEAYQVLEEHLALLQPHVLPVEVEHLAPQGVALLYGVHAPQL